MNARTLTTIAAALLGASVALGQGSTYVLDESGEWVEQPAPTLDEDASVMGEARRFLADGRPGRAKEILDAWLSRTEGERLPETPEALRLRGDALAASGNEFKALYDYERVARSYPQSDQFPLAVERELEIALRYTQGLKKKFFGLRIEPAGDIGAELLIRVHERMPGSQLGERASISLADYYFEQRDMELAVEAYDLYLANYPQGTEREKAMRRRILGNLARWRGPLRDSTSLLDARRQISVYQREYPSQAERFELDERMQEMIRGSLAAQRLEAAKWRLQRGDDQSARFILERTVNAYPGAEAAREAQAMLEARGWAEPAPTDQSQSGDAPAGGNGS